MNYFASFTIIDVSAPFLLIKQQTATFFWRDIVMDLLPADAKGIVAVFSNPCSTSSSSEADHFTYQVDGATPTFLGRGDLHESQFSSYGVERNLQEELSASNIAMIFEKSQYTGVPMDSSGSCPWSVKVYPSTTLQVQYQTSNPMWFTIGAVLIFLLTAVVFLFYGYSIGQLNQQLQQQQQQGDGRTICNLPGRRERKVMTAAAKSGAIVSSMCPTIKGEQSVFADAHSKDGIADKMTVFKIANSTTRIKSFLNESSSHLTHQLHMPLGECKSAHKQSDEKCITPPAAELFPDTTVLFSDIDGFTAWSSVREPTQVFSFLETLYGAFDAIARRRGVFKAEAIGNSYVAVCGLPEARADHAVVMTKFARDCRDKMSEITHALEKSLGPDTGDLKLRFGLSSGPVTAGVLRGDRLR
jgi:Adenylate and Guanylate cyclase catalytic domain